MRGGETRQVCGARRGRRGGRTLHCAVVPVVRGRGGDGAIGRPPASPRSDVAAASVAPTPPSRGRRDDDGDGDALGLGGARRGRIGICGGGGSARTGETGEARRRWRRQSGEARRDEARTAEMEESQTSESVAVLPDMSEPLTSETEEAAALTSEHEAHPVAVTASVTTVPGVPGVPGVGVPVSLPVGSIIGVANSTNGTTFNVITSEQLQVRPIRLGRGEASS